MQKRQLTLAVGPVVAALILGGLLYVVYPHSFSPYGNTLGATNSTYTASTGDQQLYVGNEQTIAAGQANSTANQNWTASIQGNKSNTIPTPEPRQPSGASGY